VFHSGRIVAVSSTIARKRKKERDSAAPVPWWTEDTVEAAAEDIAVVEAAVEDTVAVVMVDKQRGIAEGRTFLAVA